MDGVILTSEKVIPHPKGDILHAMKVDDIGFNGFGEAYFSSIAKGEIKGWKKHSVMTLNLVVPVGEIEFVVHDEKSFFATTLSRGNYQRLTVRPHRWVAFRGLSDSNMLLNLASHNHDPAESVNLPLEEIPYNWSHK